MSELLCLWKVRHGWTSYCGCPPSLKHCRITMRRCIFPSGQWHENILWPTDHTLLFALISSTGRVAVSNLLLALVDLLEGSTWLTVRSSRTVVTVGRTDGIGSLRQNLKTDSATWQLNSRLVRWLSHHQFITPEDGILIEIDWAIYNIRLTAFETSGRALLVGDRQLLCGDRLWCEK